MCSRVVVRVKYSASCVFSFSHCQIIWFCVIELLGNYIFKLGDCFFFESWQMAMWNFFFDFEPCRPNYTSQKMMQQWESYCLQWLLGPGWSVWGLTIASLPCSNDYSSTFVQVISMTRPLCAPAIKAKHQFLLSFERFASQQKTVFSWGVDK